jgi:hypothetical protein
MDVGATYHTAYITRVSNVGNPNQTLPRETVFAIACRNATGKTTESEVFTTMWDQFKSLNIKRVQPAAQTAMQYWGADSLANANLHAEELLAKGDGRCGAWQEIMVFAMRAQGITSGQGYGVFPVWLVPIPGSSPVVHLNVYTTLWVNATSVDGSGAITHSSPGIESQGNKAPKKDFTNHALVKYNTLYYDPSYGKVYSSLRAWEENAVGAFTAKLPTSPPTIVFVNNNPAEVEIVEVLAPIAP